LNAEGTTAATSTLQHDVQLIFAFFSSHFTKWTWPGICRPCIFHPVFRSAFSILHIPVSHFPIMHFPTLVIWYLISSYVGRSLIYIVPHFRSCISVDPNKLL